MKEKTWLTSSKGRIEKMGLIVRDRSWREDTKRVELTEGRGMNRGLSLGGKDKEVETDRNYLCSRV